MEAEIQSGHVQNTASPLVSDNRALDTKRPYVVPQLVVFGSVKALTLANQLVEGGDGAGFQS